MDEDGFVRQRRNLIVISIVLFFVQGTGLTLTEINILGNKADLTDPFLLESVLWVAWAYLLLRYWQAFKEHGSPRFLDKLNGDFRRRMEAVVNRYTPIAKPPIGAPQAELMTVGHDELKYNGWLDVRVTLAFKYPDSTQIKDDWRPGRIHVLQNRFLAFFDTAFNRSIISELYFPFMLAAFPLWQPIRCFFEPIWRNASHSLFF